MRKAKNKASEGTFSGCLNIDVSPAQHKMVYDAAKNANKKCKHFVSEIIINYVKSLQIWELESYTKRLKYNILYFINNIDENEFCVKLHCKHNILENGNADDINHMFNNFIKDNILIDNQDVLNCEIISYTAENGVPIYQIKLI